MTDKMPDSLPSDDFTTTGAVRLGKPLGIALQAQPAQSVMQSETTGKLAEALAKAQADMEQPQKNKKATIKMKAGGSYSYTYADLPTVLEHLKVALPQHGLSYVQRTRIDGNRLVLDTILMHSSGQWVSSQWPLQVSTDPKETASLLTYGRRYSLSSLCGISAEETDDDAERRGSGKSEPVTGALTKSKLQKQMREFDTDLHNVTDLGELAGLEASSTDLLAQCERDLPSWYYTQEGSDALGFEDKIKAVRRKLEAAEREGPQEPPGSPQNDDPAWWPWVSNAVDLMDRSEDLDAVQAFWTQNGKHISALPEDALEMLTAPKEAAKDRLKGTRA